MERNELELCSDSWKPQLAPHDSAVDDRSLLNWPCCKNKYAREEYLNDLGGYLFGFDYIVSCNIELK